jgi:hypothetical protein
MDEMDQFLSGRLRFADPWEGIPLDERVKLKRLPKKVYNLEDTVLVQKAAKECPELFTQKANADLIQHIFSSPKAQLTYEIREVGYVIANIPVALGSHYVGKNVKVSNSFYRILGNFARWDDAKVVIFKESVYNDTNKQNKLFLHLRDTQGFRCVGTWKRAKVEDEDYFLSLLVDVNLSERLFMVSEWELNCPQLTIL